MASYFRIILCGFHDHSYFIIFYFRILSVSLCLSLSLSLSLSDTNAHPLSLLKKCLRLREHFVAGSKVVFYVIAFLALLILLIRQGLVIYGSYSNRLSFNLSSFDCLYQFRFLILNLTRKPCQKCPRGSVGWFFWVKRHFGTVFQPIPGRLQYRGRQKREVLTREKMSKKPTHTYCTPITQINKTPRHKKFAQYQNSTRPPQLARM